MGLALGGTLRDMPRSANLWQGWLSLAKAWLRKQKRKTRKTRQKFLPWKKLQNLARNRGNPLGEKRRLKKSISRSKPSVNISNRPKPKTNPPPRNLAKAPRTKRATQTPTMRSTG